jgi:hypothetical protein
MRTGFQALRKAALAMAYVLSGRWEQIGYPGPLGPRPDAPAPRLEPVAAEGELEEGAEAAEGAEGEGQAPSAEGEGGAQNEG